VKSCAQYIAECKVKQGNPRMSDRELGELLGKLVGGSPFGQSYIAGAKSGKCTDPLAIAIAKCLEIEPGEVIWVARLEREKTAEVREHLERWMAVVKKALDLAPVDTEPLEVAGGARSTHHASSWRKR